MCSMAGTTMLSTKLPSPFSSAGSSLRSTGCPTNFSVTAISPSLHLRPGRLAGGVEDRLHDVVVAGAATEVALERVADLLLGGVRVLDQIARRREHHPGGAEAALEAVVAAERLLDRVQLAVGRHPLDRRDRSPVDLRGEERARFHRLPVEQDRARSAGRGVAADVGPGEPEGLPEEVHEERARLDVRLARDPVDGDRHVGHGSPFPTGGTSNRRPGPRARASPSEGNDYGSGQLPASARLASSAEQSVPVPRIVAEGRRPDPWRRIQKHSPVSALALPVHDPSAASTLTTSGSFELWSGSISRRSSSSASSARRSRVASPSVPPSTWTRSAAAATLRRFDCV